MMVEGVNNKETTDIVKSQESWDILEQKAKELWWTPEQTQQVKDCFSSIQKDITQPIDNYFKDINEFFLDDFLLTPEDKRQENYKKEVISFFKTQWIQLTFNVYNDLKVEEQKTKVEEEQKKLEEEQKKLEDSEMTEKQKILDNFKTTKESYEKLNSEVKTKIESESKDPKYDQQKESIRKTLEEKWLSKEEQDTYVKDYITFSLASTTFQSEIKQDPASKDFLNNFKELKKTLGEIDDLWDIAENDDLSKNRENILKNSDSLQKESQKPNEKIDNIKIEDKELEDYLSDENRDLLQKQKTEIIKKHPGITFKDNGLQISENTQITTSDKDIIDYNNLLQQKLGEVKNSLELAKKTIKEQITVSPIIGISRYMNTEVGEKKTENFLDNDFQIKTSENLRIDNYILTISGTIDGKKVILSQSLQDKKLWITNELQVNSYLATDNETISLWEESMEKLWVVLPNKELLSEQSKDRSDKNLKKIIQQWGDINEKISDELWSKLMRNYGYENIVKERLSKNIEKNIAKQEIIWSMEKILWTKIKQSDLTKERLWNQEGGNFDIIKNMIKGINELSLDQVISFRENLNMFNNYVSNIDLSNNKLNWDNILKEFTQEQKEPNKDIREKNPQQKTNIIKFIECLINKNWTKVEIKTEDFSKLTAIRARGETIQSNENQISPAFKERYERNFTTDNPDYALKNMIDKRPPDPE